MLRGVVVSTALAFAVIIAAGCADDAKGDAGADGGAAGGASAQCRAVPNADSFCSCEVAATPPSDAIDTCDSASANTACCNLPGAGAGGKGLCTCKTILCNEFSDGSCTCSTGNTSEEKPVEACNKPDEGHCCKAEGSYCTCSMSTCFDGDTEVDSCDPGEMSEQACASGESKVTDCKAALK